MAPNRDELSNRSVFRLGNSGLTLVRGEGALVAIGIAAIAGATICMLFFIWMSFLYPDKMTVVVLAIVTPLLSAIGVSGKYVIESMAKRRNGDSTLGGLKECQDSTCKLDDHYHGIPKEKDS